MPTANDEALALALQQEELGSDEDEADPDLARALAISRAERDSASIPKSEVGDAAPQLSRQSSGQETVDMDVGEDDSDDSMEEVSLVPSGRSTPAVFEASTEEEDEEEDEFEEVETPPLPIRAAPGPKPFETASAETQPTDPSLGNGFTQGFDDSAMTISLDTDSAETAKEQRSEPVMEVSSTGIAGTTIPTALPPTSSPSDNAQTAADVKTADPEVIEIKDEDEEEVVPIDPPLVKRSAPKGPSQATAPSQVTRAAAQPSVHNTGPRTRPGIHPQRSSSLLNKPSIPSPLSRSPSISMMQDRQAAPGPRRSASASAPPARLERDAPSPPSPVLPLSLVEHEPERMIDEALASGMKSRTPSFAASDRRNTVDDEDVETDNSDEDHDEDYEDDSRSIAWSRSPSPPPHQSRGSTSAAPQRPPLEPNQSMQSVDSTGSAEAPDFGDEGEDVDMNANDMVEEQDDYARFLANIKNRDLNEVRTEIDDEIRILNGQNKVAMRDSDEITLAMIAQIQVSCAIPRHHPREVK